MGSALSKITGASMPERMIPKEKKKFVDDSVDWLRENDPGRLDTVDDRTATAFTKLAGIGYDGPPLSTNEIKSKAMEDALNWIRKNDPEVDDNPDNDLVKALSKITGASKPKKMGPKRKKKFVSDSIDWLRENDPGRLDTVDEPTAMAFSKLAGIPYEGSGLSMFVEDKKNKAMLDALDWLRGNDVVMDDNPDNDLVSALSKITGASMPERMIPKEKKKFVDDSVDWLRENDPGRLDTVDDRTATAFTKLAGIG